MSSNSSKAKREPDPKVEVHPRFKSFLGGQSLWDSEHLISWFCLCDSSPQDCLCEEQLLKTKMTVTFLNDEACMAGTQRSGPVYRDMILKGI